MEVKFFVGLHQPSDCQHFERSFVSVNRLVNRKGPFAVKDWIMDSGAFSEINDHGRYRTSVEIYAQRIHRWSYVGNMLAAVSQDYMCEPFIVERTGLSIPIHQQLTIHRYDTLRELVSRVHVMPVLQGYTREDYLSHLEQYGSRLDKGMWVGVGSVCKRNSDPEQIHEILWAIKCERPDLRLHGFGLKTTALKSRDIWNLLYSADSMAWSFAARKQRKGANDWRNAKAFEGKILSFHD